MDNHSRNIDEAFNNASMEKESFAFLAPLAMAAGRMLLPMAARALAPAAGRMLGGALARGAGGSLAKGIGQNMLGSATGNVLGGAVRGALGGSGATSGPQGPNYNMIQPTSKTATYGDDFNYPSSITRRIEDPENIDPHQRPDDSNDHWNLDMKEVNEIGQSKDIRGTDDAQEQYQRIMANNENKEAIENAIEKFFVHLPKILEFFNSEESGESDPDIQDCHHAFESAFPGFMDMDLTPEADDVLLIIDKENNDHNGIKLANEGNAEVPEANRQNIDHCMKCNTPIDPSRAKGGMPLCSQHSADSSQAGSQGVASSPDSVNTEFERWGVPTNNNQNVDPQAQELLKQFEQLGNMGITASDTQGPHTDEQQAAVAEYLIEEGREEEIPNMLENPADYDAELAEMQNKQPMLGEDPEDIGMGAEEQMGQMGMGAPEAGGLPGPGMPPPGGPGTPGLPPGMPDMGAPTPADLNPAGPGAMPPPIMAHVKNDMLKSVFKYAADEAAPVCPDCGGHTTGVINVSEGACECRSCGNKWNDKNIIPSDGTSTDTSTTSSFYAALDSFIEEEQDLEPEIDDSSHTWIDEDGDPLEEGQEYEIYATNYEIPDIGRVVELKPDAIVYELESDGGLRTTIEIDRQEADLNGYRFAPTSSGDVEENPSGFGAEDVIAPEPGQTTDLSTPHREIGASAKNATAQYYMCPEPNCEFNKGGGDYEPGQCSIHKIDLVPAGQEKKAFKTAGKHYTPMEQRELIDEYGNARNADKLNLENTHYADSDPDYFLFGC